MYIMTAQFLIPSFINLTFPSKRLCNCYCLSFIIMASFFSPKMIYKVLIKFSHNIHFGMAFICCFTGYK